MTAGASASRWQLVYDGSCDFCEATSRRLVAMGVVAEAARRSFESLDEDAQHRLLEAGIRNEVAALDVVTGRVETGIAAFATLLGAAGRDGWARLLRSFPAAALLGVGYRLLAYNRRVVAPTSRARREACGCDPDPHAGYRTGFVLLLLLVAAAGYAFAGRAVEPLLAAPASGALLGLLAFAIGWLPLLALATVPAGARGERVGHLAWTAASLGLWLLPLAGVTALLVHAATPEAAARLAPWAIGGSAAGLLVVVGRRAGRRVRILEGPAWIVPAVGAWLVASAALAAGLVT